MPNKRPHADVATQWFNDDSLVAQKKYKGGEFFDISNPCFNDPETEYRIKPKPVVVKSRRFWFKNGGGNNEVGIITIEEFCRFLVGDLNFIGWIDKEWQEHEVPEETEARDYLAKCRKPSAEVERLRSALEKLACLGNGTKWGNSIGNIIAQEALATKTEGEKE